MSEKKTTEKKTITLEMDNADIFITQNAKQRSYIEQFSFSGVNFTQKHLGTLCGFFLIRDKSSWSSHIVHFLTAEIKKEYFAMPRRTLSKSFEASLHHINRALAELAKNDNIDWIGMLDSAVCSYDDTSIHFSVTGDAHILLLRDGELITISEGLTSEQAANNPLKTFVDTASGKIHAGDKIIITSQELLNLVPFDELEKNALSFSEDDFVQFITTVLTNECDMASTHILDVRERVIATNLEPVLTEEDEDNIDLPDNAFSASTYTAPRTAPAKPVTFEAAAEAEEIPEDDYVDKRTGHIYLKGDDDLAPQKKSFLSPLLDHAKDLASDASYSTKKQLKKTSKKSTALLSEIPHSTRSLISNLFERSKNTTEETSEEPMPHTQEPLQQEKPERLVPSKPQKNHTPHQKPRPSTPPKQKLATADEAEMNASIEAFMNRTDENPTTQQEQREESSLMQTALAIIGALFTAFIAGIKRSARAILHLLRNAGKIFPFTILTKILPHPRRLKKLWQSMTPKLRFTIIGFLCLMIFIPLLLLQQEPSGDSSAEETVATPAEVVDEPVVERVTNTIGNPQSIRDNIDAMSVHQIAENYIVTTPTSLIVIGGEKSEDVSLPENAGKITHTTAIPKLNAIFFVTDRDLLYSFSPANTKFEKQTISGTLNHSTILAFSAYETYLYITTKNNVIRYARAGTGQGFNSPKGRLTDDSELTSVDSMAIDDNVHFTNDGKLFILSDGKQVEQSLPADITASTIFTTTSTNNLWLLDKKTSTLYALDKESRDIKEQFTHIILEDVTSFTINEDKKSAHITTPDTIATLALENQ